MPITRITKDMVEATVKNVLNATNLEAEKQAILTEARARAHKLAVAHAGPKLVALTKKHPREWFCWTISVYRGRREETPWSLLAGESAVPVDPPAPNPGNEIFFSETDFADLSARAKAWVSKRDEIIASVRGLLQSSYSVEKFVERSPELAKHLPQKVKSYPLVAPSNALSLLMAAGFDTTEP